MIEHRIDVDEAASHRYAVTLTLPSPAVLQRLSLPVWIPGSYLVREFARHVLSIEARQGRSTRPVRAVDKAGWEVECSGRSALVVRLVVHARDASVRAAFLDAQRGFFNGTSLCLLAEGHRDAPQQLVIGRLPRGWRVATAMTPVEVDADGLGRYQAADYDELVDHPFELGCFWSADFRAGGVDHRLVVTGAWPDFDGERLLEDTRRICETTIAFWHWPPADGADPGTEPGRRSGRRRAAAGRPPFDRYVFLLNAVDDGYGGLEHRASTALIASRRDLPRRGDDPADRSDGAVTLVGLIAHEYFHSWNVKRLKPRELDRIDYARENPTRLLWFFEGFTSYYDDLLLLRSGLIDPARYLKLVGRTVTGVLGTPGRLLQSVAQASFDAWIKYYRPDENSPNATVSYYTKGSLVALSMDLALRQVGASLDGAMRRLWQTSDGGPVDETDIRECLCAEWQAARPEADAQTVRDAVDGWFADWVHGTGELPLREALAAVGVRWTTARATLPQRLGLRATDAASGVKISHVLRGGAAQVAGLAAGDELLAVDGWRLSRLEDLPRLMPAGGPARLTVSRDQRLLELELPALPPAGPDDRHPATAPGSGAGVSPIGAAVSLVLAPTQGTGAVDAAVAARRRRWLGA